MAHKFIVPDSSPAPSPAPSTPGRTDRFGFSGLGELPTTTPAGPPPPPSSAGSFTPAGAPSDLFLDSSIMRGVGPTGNSVIGSQSQNSSRNLFGRNDSSNAPLGRSIRGSQRRPSGLSRQFYLSDDNEPIGEEEEQPEDAGVETGNFAPRGSLFKMSHAADDDVDDGNDTQAEIENYLQQDMEADGSGDDAGYTDEDEEEREEEEAGDEDHEEDQTEDMKDDGDMFLNMRHDDRGYGKLPIGDEEEDLLMLNTPAATEKVRREAESVFGRSTRFGGSVSDLDNQYGSIAKNLYNQRPITRVTEPAHLLLRTEELVCRLYSEGVGTEEDEGRMDNSLANISYLLADLWETFTRDELPPPEGEELASVGPAENEEPFAKASWLANLILRLHHTRVGGKMGEELTPPVPEILFDWMHLAHNPDPDQLAKCLRYKPSPACHPLFWQSVQHSLLRGNVKGASELLRNAGWEYVKKNGRFGESSYVGQALTNVQRFVEAACEVLDQCPAAYGDWDIYNSSWTLFRIHARGSLDRMTLFAEGEAQAARDSAVELRSMSDMARKASSQIPWDIYESLQIIYDIILGRPEAILETAQDWCEATIALNGWWDDEIAKHKSLRLSQSHNLLASSRFLGSNDYFERLCKAFHLAIKTDMSPNTLNSVEVALACVFEGSIEAVIGFLRMWSLPIACSVAEIASLGGWMPETEAPAKFPHDTLDAEDLVLLGISEPTTNEAEGMKDATLVLYARELAGIDHLSPQKDGWEMAIQVLGRMDLPEKSEDTVAELLRDLLATLDEQSSSTVDKIWKILNDLGMINFAEETAQTFADILSKESHRYGEALWYYALAHRPDKVREVLNLLVSYSLIESTVYPAEKDLDDELRSLLRKRTENLERRAEQDLEAAQLLGRMLSGYATLRKFYELRDQLKPDEPTNKALTTKKQAVTALTAVISSSDDNIRGGLYDETRDAVVSEDFLLALLGEASMLINQTPGLITLDQIDILLKAIEDIQTVSSRIYSTCEEFFNLALGSGHGKEVSGPADLTKSISSLSSSGYVLSGGSMLMSQMQKPGTTTRGWDWRKSLPATTKADEVLRKLRVGLAKDLAGLYLEDADGVAFF